MNLKYKTHKRKKSPKRKYKSKKKIKSRHNPRKNDGMKRSLSGDIKIPEVYIDDVYNTNKKREYIFDSYTDSKKYLKLRQELLDDILSFCLKLLHIL